MSARRGGSVGFYKKGKQYNSSQNHHHQAEENWSLKQIIDQPKPQPQPEPVQQPVSIPEPTSSSSSSIPLSEFITDQKKPYNRRNNRRGTGSKYKVKVKPEIVNKKDENFAHSAVEKEKSGDGCSLEIENELKNDANKEEISQTGDDNVEEEDGVVKRMEELRISSKEAELSEEELKMNDQAQEDELLAMEAIYGDNIFILDNQNGLRSFQIHVHIEVPKGLSVSAKLNEFSYSFKIEHLPPIILTCLFPKSYPSHLAPLFTISVQWLDSSKISNLCHKLDTIWNEQSGQEVIYQWIDWLQNSSLSHLGFNEEIILGPYDTAHCNEDKRAISGIISPDSDIPLMKSYNDEQNHENFCKSFHECCICFNQFAGTEFAKLPCHHFFCWECMKTYSDIHVKEGTISKLTCPDTKCKGMIPPGLLKRLLGDEEFNRWEDLTLQKSLESMSDVTNCPRCDMICIEDEDQHAQCSKCFFSFCSLCRERRHVGVECLTPEIKLKILQDRQNSSQLKGEQRHKEREMINELLSVREIHRFAKQCPSCKMAISRTEGCNKMVCENCGKYFCYRCNKVISGYDHFQEGTCELFPAEEIQAWEERVNGRQVVAQIEAQLFADRGHTCPICGQINVKMGNNNHIFCWACQNHYCYLCRKTVRRSAQHFGRKGCRQHTEG